jgi:hypothetical protein
MTGYDMAIESLQPGRWGLIAMVQGPGPHLKIPSSLCGGVVKPEELLGQNWRQNWRYLGYGYCINIVL